MKGEPPRPADGRERSALETRTCPATMRPCRLAACAYTTPPETGELPPLIFHPRPPALRSLLRPALANDRSTCSEFDPAAGRDEIEDQIPRRSPITELPRY